MSCMRTAVLNPMSNCLNWFRSIKPPSSASRDAVEEFDRRAGSSRDGGDSFDDDYDLGETGDGSGVVTNTRTMRRAGVTKAFHRAVADYEIEMALKVGTNIFTCCINPLVENASKVLRV